LPVAPVIVSKGSRLLAGKTGLNGALAVTVRYCTTPVAQVLLVQLTVAPPVAAPAGGHWHTIGPTDTTAPLTPDNVFNATVWAPAVSLGMRVIY
jgi:hypothetical protein